MAASIPSGSTTLFVQPWTPVGWTRNLTYDDYALRVTNTPGADNTTGSGWAASIASNKIWTWTWPVTFGSPTGGAITVGSTVGELASHSHTYTTGYIDYGYANMTQYPGGASSGRAGGIGTATGTVSGATGSASAAAHTHPIAFGGAASVGYQVWVNVKYVDAIIASRN